MFFFLPGTEVEARNLRWEVVHSSSLGQQTLYRLRGLEGALRGHEIDLLSPFESIEPLVQAFQPERASRLSHWLVYHQAFLLEQFLGGNALSVLQPGRLKIEPYQLVPTLRAIRMRRVRLLLADSVGLGKTVQAGLVLTELIARKLAHRILVVCPAGPLLEQWQIEMRERFGLRFETIDRTKLETIRRQNELGTNPFDYVQLGLASMDFLKQERVLELLERSSYDAIVLDEAHHCNESGTLQDREDSQRRRLAEVLARQSDSLLLLSATPHDGNDRSFASLCELMDPSLVDGKGRLRGERFRPHVVRRLKPHVPGFRTRHVLPIPVSVRETAQYFKNLHRELLALVAPELRRAMKGRDYSNVLAFIALLKRSVSTAAACHETLAVVAQRFQRIQTEGVEKQDSKRQRLKTLREYQKRLDRFGALSDSEEQELASLETEDLAQHLVELEREVRSGSRSLNRVSNVLEALDSLVALAGLAMGEDPKIERVVEEIQAIRSVEPAANILIYSEYVDSQVALVKTLRNIKLGAVLVMNGSTPDGERSHITDRFRTETPCILVSTDAAAEGLNLHQQCHHLLHLELPFNPNRLEQRNGRIDRYGQQLDPIIRYLYLRGTFEERILYRLIAKYERQRERLTFVPNTLGVTTSGDASQERLLKGLLQDETRLFDMEEPALALEEAGENQCDDVATRELLEEIDHTLKGFEQTTQAHAWLGAMGLNAEKKLIDEVERVRSAGQQLGMVDLARFVCDAVLLDGGDVEGVPGQDLIFIIKLPPEWSQGLEQLPGTEPHARMVRLTTDLNCLSDGEGRPVGFLGRAHPLVQKALDRVRNLSFGGSRGLDSRVGVVQSPFPQPALLFTFVATANSRRGREMEQVLAVLVFADGTFRNYSNPNEWLSLASQKQAVNPAGAFAKFFADWFDSASVQAQALVNEHFRPLGHAFRVEQEEFLEKEKNYQLDWVRQRADDLISTITPQGAASFQPGLFDTNLSQPEPPGWMRISEPAERLAALVQDKTLPARIRSEAEGVLRLFRKRMEILADSATLNLPDPAKLGVLMLLPKEGAE